MSVKIAICGASGRMGKSLIAGVCADPETTLTGALDVASSGLIGQDAGVIAGCDACGIAITEALDAVVQASDVLIDFTVPEASLPHLEEVARHKKAMVIGTTGHSEEQKVSLARLAEQVPLVMAPNMSVGVNVLWKLIADAAKTLGDDYDVEIVEAHHAMKVDAPSGTAMRAAEVLAEALGRDLAKTAVYHREGRTGPRGDKDIGIQVIRAGDIVGDHTVYFAGPGERLEITHRASSRDTFAQGAIRAAKWLVGKQPGLYDMTDVLGLK